MEKEKWTLKDKFEVAEAIFTILVSAMALWGTFVAWENGFWHKMKHIVDEVHSKYEQGEVVGEVHEIESKLKKL